MSKKLSEQEIQDQWEEEQYQLAKAARARGRRDKPSVDQQVRETQGALTEYHRQRYEPLSAVLGRKKEGGKSRRRKSRRRKSRRRGTDCKRNCRKSRKSRRRKSRRS